MKPSQNPLPQKLSPHFSLAELTTSAMAVRKGLDNTPSAEKISNLTRLCTELLEPIRSITNLPITVTSGYRSAAVNAAVGGAVQSAHLSGFAADINCFSYGTSREFATLLVKELHQRNIRFDQLILEFDAWVHVGLYGPGNRQRGQVLTARRMANGRTEYLNGIV